MTQGKGSFEMHPSHYEEMPEHLAANIIAQAKQ